MQHVVALSGGKDSTAMALRLQELEPRDYVFVCTPTGDEPMALFAHWERLETLLGKPLMRVVDPRGLKGLIREQRALPNWRQRWCTRILKMEPFYEWLEAQTPCTSYIGLRADEPTRDGFDMAIDGISVDYPLRRWGWKLADVWRYLGERGVDIPLRTDCRRCFYQRLIEWYELWRDDPAAYADAEEDETFTGHTFRSPSRDAWPAALRDLRREFEAGRVPRDTRERTQMCRVCSL